MAPRSYLYVGPPDLLDPAAPAGHRIATAADFTAWATRRPSDELPEPFTFTVGAPVLSAASGTDGETTPKARVAMRPGPSGTCGRYWD